MGLMKSDTARTSTSTAPKSVRKPTTKKPTDDAVSAAPDAVAAPASPDAAKSSHGEIAARAYALFESRGHVHGFSNDDWGQAERELSELRARG